MNFTSDLTNSSYFNNTNGHLANLAPGTIRLVFGVLITLSILGGANNIFLAIVVFKNKKLCTGGGILIGHLLLVNGLVCIIQYPLYCISLYGSNILHWKLDSGICTYLTFLNVAPLCASAWADVCITINRLLAIFCPLKYRSLSSGPVLAAMIFSSWVISLSIPLPGALGVGTRHFKMNDGTCGSQAYGPIGMVMISLGTWCPYGLMLVGYSVMWLRIGKSMCWRQESVDPNRQLAVTGQPSGRRMRVIRMLTIMYCWNAICFIPFPFFLVYGNVNVTFRMWQRVVPLCDYGLAPLIFYAANKDYRQAVHGLLSDLNPQPRSAEFPLADVSGFNR